MLPVVRGERETRRQILLYTVLLYAVSQLPFCAGAFGTTYLVASWSSAPRHLRRGRGSCATRSAATRCASTCSRSPTSRRCSRDGGGRALCSDAARPAKKLAVVACMDARVNVERILGLEEGDAHVIRNAGAS
jgi:hypothetical protein